MPAPISDDIVRELQNAVTTAARPRRMQPLAPFSRPTPAIAVIPESPARTLFSLIPWVLGAGLVIATLLYVSRYGLHLKAQVTQQGNAAISALVSAKSALEQMDFSGAQDDFSLATEQFNTAHDELGIIGGGLGGILASLPGGGQIKAARNLIQAGQLISQTGTSVAAAVTALSHTGINLDLAPLAKALSDAKGHITQAAALLATVDASTLPAGSQEQFASFMQRLPQIQGLLDRSQAMLDSINALIGTSQARRYLVLFQNSSELRPTGGFPGSYGLVTFEHGQLRNMTADDIYNPDGQLRQLIIPPLQLQHITPSWGMRDANWFVDFPASARKVMELYQKGGGAAIDGVITIRPELIADLLRITGPISLPQYDLVLDADHFIPLIQQEVESQKTPEPKKIIMDLAPLLLAKIGSLPASEWVKALGVLTTGLAHHDVLLYMNDAKLESFIVGQGWDGGVKQTDGDYLDVNVSNVKGAKADAVTDTSLKLESWLQDGTMVHRLTVTRVHNGGHTDFGFYNKTNYSYIRALVPEGSTLRGISGNDHPHNRPLMEYAHTDAVTDPDLAALEHTYQYDAGRDVTTGQESGKTSFGFWMKVDPGKTQSIQLEYVVPASAAGGDYHLTVQRQPGLDLSNFEFTLQKSGVAAIDTATPPLTTWPDSWRLDDPLQHDLSLSIELK